ncbi:MAG: response regulator [Candidatus Aminicenantales bacterium]
MNAFAEVPSVSATALDILIVEDEAVIAMDIRMMLEHLGNKVLGIAHSGIESILKAESLRPDLILMDIKIRGEMDGVCAADEIYSRFRIPVVYITAYSDPQTLLRIRKPGYRGCLHKPLDPQELEKALLSSSRLH